VQRGAFPQSVITPGGGPTALRPPLFPIALAGVYDVVGAGSESSRLRTARLFEALLGTIAVMLTAASATSSRGSAFRSGTR
jgi:hypothetical protein